MVVSKDSFYYKLFIEPQSDKRYYALEWIPPDGQVRARNQNGEREIYPVNLLSDIQRGYKEVIRKEESLFLPLRKFSLGTFNRQLALSPRGYPALKGVQFKHWIFLQYQETDAVSFIGFDFDNHGNEKLFKDQIAKFKAMQNELGFECLWTTSVGDISGGMLKQGVYAWIVLKEPHFVYRLRKTLKALLGRYGLEKLETTVSKPHVNVRLPFQYRMGVVSDSCQIWNKKTVARDFTANCRLLEAVKPFELKGCGVPQSLKQPQAAVVNVGGRKGEDRENTSNSGTSAFSPPKTPFRHLNPDAFERALETQIHLDIARHYKFKRSNLDAMTADADKQWRIMKPDTSKKPKWHRARFHNILKHVEARQLETRQQDYQRVEHTLKIDIAKAKRVFSEQGVTQDELRDFESFLKYYIQTNGRMAADVLYRDRKRAIFSKRRWFYLRDTLMLGIIETANEYDYSIHKCRQYKLTKAFIKACESDNQKGSDYVAANKDIRGMDVPPFKSDVETSKIRNRLGEMHDKWGDYELDVSTHDKNVVYRNNRLFIPASDPRACASPSYPLQYGERQQKET